jgi:hypothetical protein
MKEITNLSGIFMDGKPPKKKGEGLLDIIRFFGNFYAMDILYHIESLDYLIK